MDNQNIHVLRFLVQHVRICVDLNMISKIFLIPTMIKIPDSPDYLAGIVNVHGISVPIIDLTLRLNLERKNPYSLDTSIILCQVGNREVGLIVDKILDIKTFDKKNIQMDTTSFEGDNLYHGTINLEAELYLILNIANIMNTYHANKPEIAYEHNN